MSYWAIDAAHLDGDEFVVKRRRPPRIDIDDEVILFDVDQSGHVVFLSMGEVRRTATKNINESYFSFSAQIGETRKFTSSRPLLTRRYSLECVYNYSRPHRHFRRSYRSLSRRDFDTISDGSIFWARTAFSEFVTELPREATVAFVAHLASEEPRLLTGTPEFSALWSRLRQFIVDEYYAGYKLLSSIASLMRTAAERIDGLEPDQIALTSVDNEKLGVLWQHQRMSAFFESIGESADADGAAIDDAGGPPLFQELSRRIEESAESEVRFEQIFRGTGWPIPQTIL